VTLLACADDLQTFTAACNRLGPELRAELRSLIVDHETDEWLADAR
jgi:hypothetical protein